MKKLILYSLLFCTMACKKSHSPDAPPAPAAAILVSPTENEVCTTGGSFSDTESLITFTWRTAERADNYELVVKNLLTSSTTSKTTDSTKLVIKLTRATPYSWYIVSHSNNGTKAQSATWKFYNAGLATTAYSPFPPTLTSPVYGQSISGTTVKLSWQGSAPTGTTIVGYDVYFGTTVNPPLIKSDVTDTYINDLVVSAKIIYYWKVAAKDAQGNTAISDISYFSVN